MTKKKQILPYPVFGSCKENTQYIHRPGAYGVFVNEEGMVATAEDDHILFLPGGGIESGETPLDCLKREILEELGAKVNVLWEIGLAGEYIYTGKGAEQSHYFKLGHFYYVQIIEIGQHGVPEHSVVWMPLAEAATSMNHLSHGWAIQQIKKVSSDGN